jgi:hypothetical protein
MYAKSLTITSSEHHPQHRYDLYRYTGGGTPLPRRARNNQPIEICVLMATRESPEEMSRMFTENVCMDFDQLILALVQLLRTL